MTEIDLSTWLTKAQAAAAIGVSTKAIERFTQAGKLEQRRRPQARGPQVAVYFPDDVAKLAQDRQREAKPFVLAAGSDPTHGNGARTPLGVHSLRVTQSLQGGAADPLHLFAAALVQAVMSQTSQTGAPPAAYVDVTEALAIAGVSYGALRRAVKAGEVKQRGRRYRRTDLEQL